MGERFDNTRRMIVSERPVGPVEEGFDIHGNKVVSSTDSRGTVSYIIYHRPDHNPIMDQVAAVVASRVSKEFADGMNA